MSLDALKQNIEEERKIARELIMVDAQTPGSPEEGRLLQETKNHLTSMLRIINNSIPSLVDNISMIREIPASNVVVKKEERAKGLLSISYKEGENEKLVAIPVKDKREFIEKLKLSRDSLKKLRIKERVREAGKDFRKPSLYAKISNKFFLNLSSSITGKGHFLRLKSDLRKSNIPFMLNTYLAMGFFTTLLVFFISIFILAFFLFFSINLSSPGIINPSSESILLRFGKFFWIIFVLPLITFVSFYFYPITEKDSIRKRVNLELPFVTIHMSAVAGSGIEPTQIFKIIALGKEYKYTGQELKKVINQVNVYGYDLVNALKNSADSTASDKLADLFNGLATTISTGGSLTEYLDKRSETLLFDYKLDKEKYNKVAETFMDIYISIIIAAPMIMMLLLILSSIIPGGGLGLSVGVLTTIIIGLVALLNVVFIVFLQLKQREI